MKYKQVNRKRKSLRTIELFTSYILSNNLPFSNEIMEQLEDTLYISLTKSMFHNIYGKLL